MEQSPLVSIIMRAYNARRYIMEALESALAQTYRPIEIIVVDDGSTDGTQELLAPLIAEGKIRYVRQEHQGPWPTANRGLKEARGEFIQIFDADDIMFPQKIERQVERILKEPTRAGELVVAMCSYYWFNDETPDDWQQSPRDLNAPEDLSSFSAVFGFQAFSQRMLIPKQVYDRCGVYDESLPALADWEFWARMAIHGIRPIYDFSPLWLYRKHESNLTKQPLRVPRAWLMALHRVKKILEQRGWQPYSKEEIREAEEQCCYELGRQLLLANQRWKGSKHLALAWWFSRRRRQVKALMLLAAPFMRGDNAVRWAARTSDRLWALRRKLTKRRS